VGFSSDEASAHFSTDARNTMWTITGVDVRPLVHRGKFVFITQIGSPQKIKGPHNAVSSCKVGSRDLNMSEVLRRFSMNCEMPHCPAALK